MQELSEPDMDRESKLISYSNETNILSTKKLYVILITDAKYLDFKPIPKSFQNLFFEYSLGGKTTRNEQVNMKKLVEIQQLVDKWNELDLSFTKELNDSLDKMYTVLIEAKEAEQKSLTPLRLATADNEVKEIVTHAITHEMALSFLTERVDETEDDKKKDKEKKISKRPRVFPIRNGGTFEVLPVLTEQEEAEKEVVAEREHKDAWKAKLNDLVRLLILNILY